MRAVRVAELGRAFDREQLPGARLASFDADSRRWLIELRDPGPVGDRAVQRLHSQLLRMAYARLLGWHPQPPRGDLEDVALAVADDSVVAVLAHLDDFRQASRFTTWACQFALTEVSVAMRKRRRSMREVATEPNVIAILAGARNTVEHEVEETDLLRCVSAAVNDVLSARQREVLVTVAIDGESPSSMAVAHETNAGAVYKSLHDARRKLRAHLRAHGFATRP
jgi:RNA polymerase sigma-70 factor (ECF subfamily)